MQFGYRSRWDRNQEAALVAGQREPAGGIYSALSCVVVATSELGDQDALYAA